jgi:hypothetical protein
MTDAGGRTVDVWLNDGDTVEAGAAALIDAGMAEPNAHFQPVRCHRPGEDERAATRLR